MRINLSTIDQHREASRPTTQKVTKTQKVLNTSDASSIKASTSSHFGADSSHWNEARVAYESHHNHTPESKGTVRHVWKNPRDKSTTKVIQHEPNRQRFGATSSITRKDRERHTSVGRLNQTLTDWRNVSITRYDQRKMMSEKSYKSEKNQVDEEEEKRLISEEPLRKRVFIHVAQTSTSIQVAWSYAPNLGKKVQYILEYGVGIKVSGKEQFRQIYKGKAHKCIITDLMPRTSYWFRVAPFKLLDNAQEKMGEWSEIKVISTYDYQEICQESMGHHAQIISKKNERWANFEK